MATLAEGLQSASVDWGTLHRKYSPQLNLVRELIGIVPNCDPLLEIWPPGFRTYNLLVPNMFNLPNTLFGSKSFKASMGLAMYASNKRLVLIAQPMPVLLPCEEEHAVRQWPALALKRSKLL